MIISKLKGGLGNQLFQYATGFSLAKKLDAPFKIDVSGYEKSISARETARNLDINDFSISANVASDDEILEIKYPKGIISRIGRVIEKKLLKNYYVDWHPQVLLKTGNVYLDGYFQSDKYFQSEVGAIFEQFSLRQQWLDPIQEIVELINQCNRSVSLHIRRGDYAGDSRVSRLFLVCNAQYYQRAISYFLERIPDCNFYIFSDDVQWVEHNLLLPSRATFISSENGDTNRLRPSQELVLMSKCKHHILSNSSFSWWGAYLNQSKEKIVLAPDIWNNGYVDQPNIAPEAWIRFPTS